MSSPDAQAPESNTASAEHGAVIDSNGREIPITENMIQQACSELDKQVVSPKQDEPH